MNAFAKSNTKAPSIIIAKLSQETPKPLLIILTEPLHITNFMNQIIQKNHGNSKNGSMNQHCLQKTKRINL